MERFREASAMGKSYYFQLIQSWFVTLRKKLEELNFVDVEFLHRKITNKDVYVWIMCATENIPEDACNLRQYESGIGDLTVLKSIQLDWLEAFH